jgi:transposase-like protein
MARKYRKIEELSTADLGFSLDDLRGRSLEELSRRGAKLLLEVALAEEVSELLGRHRYQRGTDDGGYRNGHRRRRVQTGAGPVEVEMPKVTGALLPHRSEILPAWKRRSEDLTEVLSLLYAEGLSTRDCLTFYRFPQEHWKRLRTSNVIERAFREVRRRTDVVGRFPGEMAALVLIWATMEEDRLVWRGVQMDGDLRMRIVEAAKTASADAIDVSVLDRYKEAA